VTKKVQYIIAFGFVSQNHCLNW